MKRRIRVVGIGIFIRRCPVGYPVMGGIHAGEQTDAGGRTNGHGIGIGKFDPFTGHAFHSGRMIPPVEGRCLSPERYRRILPAHIIDQKYDNIGLGGGAGCRCLPNRRLGTDPYRTNQENHEPDGQPVR